MPEQRVIVPALHVGPSWGTLLHRHEVDTHSHILSVEGPRGVFVVYLGQFHSGRVGRGFHLEGNVPHAAATLARLVHIHSDMVHRSFPADTRHTHWHLVVAEVVLDDYSGPAHTVADCHLPVLGHHTHMDRASTVPRARRGRASGIPLLAIPVLLDIPEHLADDIGVSGTPWPVHLFTNTAAQGRAILRSRECANTDISLKTDPAFSREGRVVVAGLEGSYASPQPQ